MNCQQEKHCPMLAKKGLVPPLGVRSRGSTNAMTPFLYGTHF